MFNNRFTPLIIALLVLVPALTYLEIGRASCRERV